MKTCFLLVPLCGLALSSCEKVRTISDSVTSTVKEKVAKEISGKLGGTAPAGEVDEKLQALVDQTPEGVVFRKDLPFPKVLEVNETTSRHVSVRLFQSSPIENKTSNLDGIMASNSKFERSGDHIRVTMGEVSFTDPTAKEAEGGVQSGNGTTNKMISAPPPRVFRRENGTWKADRSAGFAGAVLSRDLGPVFDQLLQDHSLSPRPIWFGERRLKIGEEVTLTGKSLPLVVGGSSSGSLKLRLDALEPVAGHPCGVFSVSGDYNREQVPAFDGSFTDEEVSIESGKIWLSLIHPLICQWDIQYIHTYQTGPKGGGGVKGQGTESLKRTITWKSLEP